MFGNIGWGEMVVIVIAGLVILGPERLPGAMSWLARSLKQVRAYATGAQTQLRDELGPEFEDLRKPLSELQELRGMSPRAAITKHLLDGDDSLFTGEFDRTEGRGGSQAGTGAPPDGDARAAGQGDGGGRTPGAQASSAGRQQDSTPQQWNGPGAASQQQSDTSAIKPVFDEDAT